MADWCYSCSWLDFIYYGDRGEGYVSPDGMHVYVCMASEGLTVWRCEGPFLAIYFYIAIFDIIPSPAPTPHGGVEQHTTQPHPAQELTPYVRQARAIKSVHPDLIADYFSFCA